jgi:hypothetical protein
VLVDAFFDPEHPIVKLPRTSGAVAVEVEAAEDLGNLLDVGLIPGIGAAHFGERPRQKLAELAEG